LNAIQLLEEVKKLPSKEREELIDSLLELELEPKGNSNETTIVWPDIEARARLIFGESVFPNMVLEERNSRPF
jgi:hypothetical protein